jgi:hypothetical protein
VLCCCCCQPTTTMTIFWSWDEVHQIQEGGCCSQNHYPITCYLVLPPIFKFSEMISIIYVFHHKMVSISVVYIYNHLNIYMFKTINFRNVYRPFYHFWARNFSDFFTEGLVNLTGNCSVFQNKNQNKTK